MEVNLDFKKPFYISYITNTSQTIKSWDKAGNLNYQVYLRGKCCFNHFRRTKLRNKNMLSKYKLRWNLSRTYKDIEHIRLKDLNNVSEQ